MSISEIEATLRRKLENVELANTTLHEELDRVRTDNNSLVDENASLADENTHTRKKVTSLQQEIANQHNEYSRIESEFYNQGQEVERLKKENITFLKNKREAERKLREETLAFEKDRLSSQERETELIEQLKAVQETVSVLAQQEFQKKQQDQEFRKKHSQYSSNGEVPANTYSLISMFSPSSALSSIAARLSTTTGDETVTDNLHNAARDAKAAQRTVKEQDRLINQLKTEIENAKQATTDSLAHNKNMSLRINQLENELEQVKRVKRSLEEENEGFQSLLHEKTMKGEFMLNPIMQRHDSFTSRKSRRYANHGKGVPMSNDLAAELDRASAGLERVQKESDQITDEEEIKSLKEEIKLLKDDNKSLRLYIQKILDRIMEAQGYEEILSTEWSKKPPSQPNTPIVTTFSHVRSQSKQSNLIPEDKEAAAKKLERRKTLSGAFSFRGSKPNNIKIPPNNADEIQDQLSPLVSSPTYLSTGIGADDKTDRQINIAEVSEAPKTRHLRRNSSSDGGARKRWSLWWNQPKPEEKKEDPFMRPIVLVQENERTK